MYERFSTQVRKLNQNFLSGDSFKYMYCNQMNIHTIMSQNQRTSSIKFITETITRPATIQKQQAI